MTRIMKVNSEQTDVFFHQWHMPRPWSASMSLRFGSNIVSEEYYCTQETGLSLDQPGSAECTSPEGMPVHTCSNNELSILDYPLSANAAVKRRLKKRKKPTFSTFPVPEMTLSLLFVMFLSASAKAFRCSYSKKLTAMHSSLVCHWSCWFFLCLFAWLWMHYFYTLRPSGYTAIPCHTPFTTHLCGHQQS